MAKKPSQSAAPPAPRLYLVTPLVSDTTGIAKALPDVLGAADVAALLLRLAPADERTLTNRVKALAPIAQANDVALVIDGHLDIVARAGADGCHVSDVTALRTAASALKPSRILGAGNLTSRHDAMLAGESGADYVMFGEPDAEGARPSLTAIIERVEWWAEVFEIPCVAFAATVDEIEPLCDAGADFIALGDGAFSDPRGWANVVAEAAKHMRAKAIA
jgi:thiamine-phosphate pyrophosphorylase